MILTPSQIKSIVLDNPGKERVARGREYCDKLRRHIYGENLESHLKAIEGFERASLHEARKKYSKSNKDLFSRIGRPADKVFTAKGGSVYLNLGEEAERRAKQITQDVKDGYSVRKWVETFWRPHYFDDPYGITFMEISPFSEAIRLRAQGKSFVHPTYKGIHWIYDYLPKGNRLEYVVFELSESDKQANGFKPEDVVYRVVDDAADYIVKKESKDVLIYDALTLVNPFGEVPAILNSDITDPLFDNCFLSMYDDIIELAEQFLLKGSIKVTHDFLHGFPKYSEFASTCSDCNGTGRLAAKTCEACNGTGKRAMLKVNDVKVLEWPSKEDAVILPSNIGGYVSPDRNYYEIATADLQALEDAMTVTLWGTQSRLKTAGLSQTNDATKTATEIVDEIKPQADRLVMISETAEQRHKFILDMVIRLQVAVNYQGSSVSYGRRYMLEGPDAVWLKYSDARTKGAPQNVLDTLLNEYYEANYQSDPVGLAIAKKLMYVEPFVHFTAAVLKGLSPDPADYKAKLYFSEWLATISEATLLVADTEQLKQMLNEFASVKQLPEPKSEPIAA